MILDVALPVPLPKTFDYLLPPGADESDPNRLIGRRVRVPFGRKQSTGVVVAVKDVSSGSFQLKHALEFLDPEPALTAPMLELAAWLARRTVCSFGEAVFALLPPGKNKSAPRDPAGTAAFDELHEGRHGSSPQLTGDQTEAARRIHEAIYSDRPSTFLLHGVAAAGKTEVYLAAIKDALDQGKTALYLVPEIGLAMQTMDVLKTRFGHHSIVLWHSDIAPTQRAADWERIRSGIVSIVVGPRSAALAPLANVKVVIVDEEHDHSYKEERKPRFHARDVALFRARQTGGVAVLGSATPSLESFHSAETGEAILLTLNERAIPARAPEIRVVNVASEKTRGALSPSLQKAIGERLRTREQAILFLNRRGFFRFLRCPSCSWVAECPQCAVAVVYHKAELPESPQPAISPKREKVGVKGRKKKAGLWCHYCGYFATPPESCPQCGQKKMYSGGYGTQRVVEEVQALFPWARIARWDRDAIGRKGKQEEIFRQFREGESDILVGTQMVAQGFNFPHATLVGVVDADLPLHIPDFRAGERTFQLLAQVAGRAGRAMVTGEVILQTKNPDHYALAFASALDYPGFAREELKHREDLNYPPFSHLVQVLSQARDPRKSDAQIHRLAEWAAGLPLDPPIGVLGPRPALHLTKAGKTRFQLLLKVKNAVFDEFLELLSDFIAPTPHQFMVDVDPETMR